MLQPLLSRFAIASVLFTLVGTSLACSPPSGVGAQDTENADENISSSTEQTDESQAERVKVAAVLVETIERSLEAVANIESLDVVDVLPERAEPVIRLLVGEGDLVSKGQVMAKLRDRVAKLAFKEAEVRVNEAANEVNRADRDYKRNRQLADQPDGTSLLSERDLENSEQAQLAARTAHQSAQVALDRAQLDLDRCTLVAPIDGTVTMRDISVGDQTVIGQRAFQVADLAHPRVIFYRPQSEFGALAVGQKLTATSEAYPDQLIKGQIERIAPIVDAESGTIKVTAILQTTGQKPLPNGLLVRLRLVLESRPNAVLVPKRALNHDGDIVFIFLIRDNVAKRVEIQTGFENPTHIQALDSNIDADDVVVIVGQDRLDDGDAVEVLSE